jgi:hypothetical protein
MSRKVELVFSALFVLFFVLWLNQDLLVPLGLVNKSGEYYMTKVDPITLNPPAWLKTINWYAFACGPFYLLTAYGFFRRKCWLPYVLLPLAGFVVATTGIYIAADVTGNVPPLNLTVFYISNLPYIIVHILAAIWVIVQRRKATSARV